MDLLTKVLIAKLAYEPDREIITNLMHHYLGYGDIKFLYVKKVDCEAHIFRYGDNCIIAFAGTESLRDVITDAFFIPSCYKKGFVHSGFLSTINEIKDEMNDLISELFPIGLIKHMDLVGHSLGASLASLAVDEVKAITLTDQVTAFAPPNGFSRAARKYLTDQYDFHNITNRFDPVTMAMGITSSRPETTRTKLRGKFGRHGIQYYIDALMDLKG